VEGVEGIERIERLERERIRVNREVFESQQRGRETMGRS
jgi:hypothetical protein